ALAGAWRAAYGQFDRAAGDHLVAAAGGHVDGAGGAVLERAAAAADVGVALAVDRDVGHAGHDHQAGLASRLAAGMALASGQSHHLETDVFPTGAGWGHLEHAAVGGGGMLANAQG